MAGRQDKQQALVPPPISKYIPYGKFTAIDDAYYNPVPPNPVADIFSRGRTLKPHGGNVKYGTAVGFQKSHTPISLETGSLKVNYGSYIYQQQTGFDNAHPPGGETKIPQLLFL